MIASGIAAIAAAALLAAVPAAAEATTTYVVYDQGKRQKPASINSQRVLTDVGLRPYDETIYRSSGLHWTRWGSRRAVGRGKVTFCVIEYRPCQTVRGSVVLTQPVKLDDCPTLIYSRLRWQPRGLPWSKIIDLPAGEIAC